MSDVTLNITSQILPQSNMTVGLPHTATLAFSFFNLFSVTDTTVCVYLYCFDFSNLYLAFLLSAHFWTGKLTTSLHFCFNQVQTPIPAPQQNSRPVTKTKANSLLFLFAIPITDRHPPPPF